jgi:hypothetical protein
MWDLQPEIGAVYLCLRENSITGEALYNIRCRETNDQHTHCYSSRRLVCKSHAIVRCSLYSLVSWYINCGTSHLMEIREECHEMNEWTIS